MVVESSISDSLVVFVVKLSGLMVGRILSPLFFFLWGTHSVLIYGLPWVEFCWDVFPLLRAVHFWKRRKDVSRLVRWKECFTYSTSYTLIHHIFSCRHVSACIANNTSYRFRVSTPVQLFMISFPSHITQNGKRRMYQLHLLNVKGTERKKGKIQSLLPVSIYM